MPKFSKQYADVGVQIHAALKDFCKEVYLPSMSLGYKH